jgi:hypothetical protein
MVKAFGVVTAISPHPKEGHKQIELKIDIPFPLAEEEGQTFEPSEVRPDAELKNLKVGDKIPVWIREKGDPPFMNS